MSDGEALDAPLVHDAEALTLAENRVREVLIAERQRSPESRDQDAMAHDQDIGSLGFGEPAHDHQRCVAGPVFERFPDEGMREVGCEPCVAKLLEGGPDDLLRGTSVRVEELANLDQARIVVQARHEVSRLLGALRGRVHDQVERLRTVVLPVHGLTHSVE